MTTDDEMREELITEETRDEFRELIKTSLDTFRMTLSQGHNVPIVVETIGDELAEGLLRLSLDVMETYLQSQRERGAQVSSPERATIDMLNTQAVMFAHERGRQFWPDGHDGLPPLPQPPLPPEDGGSS